MPPRRVSLLLLLAVVPLALGGCFFPPGGSHGPKVVQESEPNDTQAQANPLPLAPDSFSGSVTTGTDNIDYWTYTPTRAGTLTVAWVACSNLEDVEVFTATDTGTAGQCTSGGITSNPTIHLTAGEQVFVTPSQVTSGTYTYKASFTPDP